MRYALLLLLLAPALAGCTSENGQVEFTPTCPNWIQSPGHPGAVVQSAMYRNQSGEIVTAHLKGVNVHTPTLLKENPYEWNDGVLDVIEWNLVAYDKNGNLKTGVADGRYIIKAYAASTDIKPTSDGESVTYDKKYRQEQLYFRDPTAPSGSQYKLEIVLDSSTGKPLDEGGYGFTNKTYRIELTQPNEPTNPKALWLEYTFIPNLDNDQDTDSVGLYASNITYWYRTCGQSS